MNLVFPIFLFAIMGLVIPAYAQNTSNDKVDIMIRELIKECQDKVMASEFLTDAEKTVAKRNCETDITNEYKNVESDYRKLSEKRSKLNKIQYCEDWHPQYRFLAEYQFRLQKNDQTVSDCILLYHDTIWKYVGEDRIEKLSERLDEIKSELAEDHETKYASVSIDIQELESKIIDTHQGADKVADLEEKVRLLEEELAKKDDIIREQLKVLIDLTNKIKKVMFGTFDSFWFHA